MSPFLLAADKGYWKVLQKFMEYYDDPDPSLVFNNLNLNPFDVHTSSFENVLHLALSGPRRRKEQLQTTSNFIGEVSI